ncbi:uncharacterized protein BHQ10_000982 [Talaromyces amestolkiae]|uniref:Thioesterase domain-containing protein n=1 Tax=Talaromyces amestolkiae TaxID=1196081 RepID=A0A364KN46_TALAM|nr:uncharacterized protein BHQ10_000982 [Talaromyces amestolkiae]RAO64970.1 hypothetical protein BHQ10_000982 [Talaromyces amestolkiae]
MFHTSRTQHNALYFLHGVPRSFRRHVVPTQLTSTPLRHNTTVALETRRVPRFKWTRRIFWGLLFGGLGYFSTDSSLKRFFHPAEPGSKEDAAKLGYLRKWVDRLPRVQELRLRPNYEEWDAYEDTTDKERRLTSGALKGSRALAVQKIFWNKAENACINVVQFGNSTDGWPTVVHGGAIATVLDEQLGRVAILSVPAHTGVTAHLDINYHRPVSSGQFYTITATLDKERSTDRKSYVTAVVFDQEENIYCTASALFVVPKNIPLKPLERF